MTTHLKIALVVAFLAGILIPPGIRAALASDDAGVIDASSTPADAGPQTAIVTSGSGVAIVTTPASQLHDPLENPMAAWQDELGARKDGWPVALWAAIAMLAKALAYAERSPKWKGAPVIGPAITWLAIGKRAMAIAAVGVVAPAIYNALALGGSWGAALVAGGMAIAGLTHSTTQPASSV